MLDLLAIPSTIRHRDRGPGPPLCSRLVGAFVARFDSTCPVAGVGRAVVGRVVVDRVLVVVGRSSRMRRRQGVRRGVRSRGMARGCSLEEGFGMWRGVRWGSRSCPS